MRGESTFIEDYALETQRYGLEETAYFTFCYSPVYDEKGMVIGLLGFVRKVLPAGQRDHGCKALGQLVVASAYSAVLL